MTAPTVSPQAVPRIVPVDGSCSLPREEIGGKAWGVNRMCALGLVVPPAFVISTRTCREYFAKGPAVLDELWEELTEQVHRLESATERRFGDPSRPLLVSVRSGAARSMPGMMDTVLNLGINAAVARHLAAATGDARYAAETHRRFVAQYARIVPNDGGSPVPDDAWEQLRATVAAVFDSWNSPRAMLYRRNRGLSDDGGTAVMIQAMVFGNLDDRSGTGVVFSRNPMTGERPAWGEWLRQAQGEDVVAGTRTPDSLDELRRLLPSAHDGLIAAAALLERDARDIQDIEFTVESGKLWLLQCRVAKRSPQAALRAAVAFVDEGLISPDDALDRLDPDSVRHLSLAVLATQATTQEPILLGEPACPGVATGILVSDPREAERRSQLGEDVILARPTTSPEDLQGVIASRALITETGGSTSHAAVVSRELGRPCIVGCGKDRVGSIVGQRVTLDGTTGRIWAGDLTAPAASDDDDAAMRRLVAWGLPRVRLRILPIGESPREAVDLDALGEAWHSGLQPHAIVRGRVLDTDDGLRAALAAGVEAVIVRNRLAAILTCLRASPTFDASSQARIATTTDHAGSRSDFTLLRVAALKGRAALTVLGDSLSLPVEATVEAYDALRDRGLCIRTPHDIRVTGLGRQVLQNLLAAERSRTSPTQAAAVYAEFSVLNRSLKQIVTAWQILPDGSPNKHLDTAYDGQVLQKLADLHRSFLAFSTELAALAPRLAIYRERLDRAAERIRAGDTAFVARTAEDSYHTIWFELHEDLLSISGRTRRDPGSDAA